jgi:hypothetical protein
MPSSVSWIDFDSEAQQRAQRILTLFNERDTRDELGFGPIRDAISNTLFPGTSTIHTRLRYMLLIPWIYRELEERRVPSHKITERARSRQLQLAEALKRNTPDEFGIIGRGVGAALKTLPGSIYWAGLGSWGLRLYPGTTDQYHRALNQVYRRRKATSARQLAALEEGDDVGGLWEHGAHTWHPGITEPPGDFLESARFDLSRDEARFLQERVRHCHRNSLLADLMAEPRRVSVSAPWDHPDIADFQLEHRTLLEHGHNFSVIVFGAAVVYNQLLAEARGDESLLEEHREAGRQWLERFDARLDELIGWGSDLSAFWTTVADTGHQIGARTMRFVEDWVRVLLQYRETVFDEPEAKELIRSREIEKKRGSSRFTNQRVLDQWGGRSGLVPLAYRWDIAESYVSDLARAIGH